MTENLNATHFEMNQENFLLDSLFWETATNYIYSLIKHVLKMLGLIM